MKMPVVDRFGEKLGECVVQEIASKPRTSYFLWQAKKMHQECKCTNQKDSRRQRISGDLSNLEENEHQAREQPMAQLISPDNFESAVGEARDLLARRERWWVVNRNAKKVIEEQSVEAKVNNLCEIVSKCEDFTKLTYSKVQLADAVEQLYDSKQELLVYPALCRQLLIGIDKMQTDKERHQQQFIEMEQRLRGEIEELKADKNKLHGELRDTERRQQEEIDALRKQYERKVGGKEDKGSWQYMTERSQQKAMTTQNSSSKDAKESGRKENRKRPLRLDERKQEAIKKHCGQNMLRQISDESSDDEDQKSNESLKVVDNDKEQQKANETTLEVKKGRPELSDDKKVGRARKSSGTAVVKGKRGRKSEKNKDAAVGETVMEDWTGGTGDPELCSHPRCQRPLHMSINWVQCDDCDKWFHTTCVFGSNTLPGSNDEFHCYDCRDAEGEVTI